MLFRSEYKYFYSFIILCLIPIFISKIEAHDPLTPKEVQEFDRMSSPVLSPDGKYVVYTIRKWTESTSKSYTNLQLTEISSKKRGFITPAVLDQSDSNPIFSSEFPMIKMYYKIPKKVYHKSRRAAIL